MNVLQRTRRQAARGLTLIELVVVLAILVALVGLVLAFFPGLLSRASRSTSASSLQDVARAVQINYTTQLTYGTAFDSLLNAPAGGALYSLIPPLAAAQMTPGTVTAQEVAALSAVGITTYRHMTNTVPNDATFNISGPAVALAASGPVALINNAAVQNALLGNYVPTNPKFVVFGLNKGASIIGGTQILQDAPVRAGANANENPTTSYQRYGLVFVLEDQGTGRNARFLGACAFSATGITTAENNLQEYYAN